MATIMKFKSSDHTENMFELFYLLHFFSQTRLEQWQNVPISFPPIWARIGSIECNVYNPIYFLSCVFIGCIEESVDISWWGSDDAASILRDEIKPLLDNWMTEYNDSIFEKEEISNANKIWLILSRLCKIVLSSKDWKECEINKLSFAHFVEKYTSEYDPV
jgi:hypothetical protein